MFKFLIITTIIAFVAAQHEEAYATILKQFYHPSIGGDDKYEFAYETSNHITGEQSGIGGQYATGSNSWYAADGTHIYLSYTADEHGYHPKYVITPASH